MRRTKHSQDSNACPFQCRSRSVNNCSRNYYLTLEDSELKTLQSLAAHLKLLLDCPEHFWKLLERRQYLDAAWLFLVAQVVYHSLVDEEDEEEWSDQNIDVLEQFPLVQRQWDAISGFRAQISHKATQSLREELTFQVCKACKIWFTLNLS